MLKLLELKVKEGIEIRLIHAKEPGKNFRDDFDKYPLLWSRMERVLCPRVHFKILIFDLELAYIGSANLTGAAFGMKGKDHRNFEAGILTSEADLVSEAVEQSVSHRETLRIPLTSLGKTDALPMNPAKNRLLKENTIKIVSASDSFCLISPVLLRYQNIE